MAVLQGLLLLLFPLKRIFLIGLKRNFFKQGFVGDSSVHFSIFKHVRSEQSRYIKQYLISPAGMCYPVLFHKLFSFLKPQYIKKYPYIPNLFLYSFLFPLAYGLIIWHKKLDLSEPLSLIILVLMLSDFNVLYVERKNIAYLKFSERLLGRLSVSLMFLLLYFYLDSGNIQLFLIAIILGVVGMLSAKFSRQTIIFVTPILGISFMAIELIVFAPLVIFLTYLVGGSYFADGFKNMTTQWRIYRTRTKASKTVQANISKFFSFSAFRLQISFLNKLKYLLKSEPLGLVFYPNFCLALINGSFFDYQFLFPFLIIYLLTSTDRFNHLGESIRYLEYGLTFVLFSIIAKQPQIFLILCVGINMSLFICYVLYLFILNKEQLNDDLTDFLNQSKIPQDSRVFPVSMRTGADLCARGDYVSFWWQPGIVSDQIYKDFIIEYPFLKTELIHKYEVDYILVDRKEDQKKDWQYDFEGYDLMHSNKLYKLYKT